MKSSHLVAAAVASALALPALADDWFPSRWPVDKTVELKDGATLIVYKDGKTAVEDRYGRPAGVKPGEPVETRRGERIVLESNEIERLDASHPAPDG